MKKWLWALIVIGLCIRFQAVLSHNPLDSLWSDPIRHWHNALNPLSQTETAAFDPLMYQLWLGIIAKITLGDHLAIGIYTGLLSVLVVFIWHLFFEQIFPDQNTCLFATACTTYLPSWISIYSYFMNETLFLPLLGLALYLTYKNLKEKNLKSFSQMSIAWLIASLTKIIALPLGLIAIFYCLRSQNQKKQKLLTLALISFLILLPSAYRTHKIMGIWAPFGYIKPHQIYMRSGYQEATFTITKGHDYVFNWGLASPSLYVEPFKNLFEFKSIRQGNLEAFIDGNEGIKDWEELAHKTEIKFPHNLVLWFENVILFFFAQPWPDRAEEYFWENLNSLMRWFWAPAFLIALSGNLAILKHKRSLPLFVILNLLGWLLCVFSLDVNEPRYHKPLEVLLITNLIWLWKELKSKQQLAAYSLEETKEKLLCTNPVN